MDAVPTNKAQKGLVFGFRVRVRVRVRGHGLGLGLGFGLKSNIFASVGIASIGIVTRNQKDLLSPILVLLDCREHATSKDFCRLC